MLQLPSYGNINVHGSLLPKYRGAAPIQWAIANGEAVTGVTTMQLDEGLDTGPMLLTRDLDIRAKSAGEGTQELARIGAEALVCWLSNPTAPQPQPADGVTYAAKIDKAEARIDWSKPAIMIERASRAFDPVPGAWFEVNGERVKLLAAEVVERGGIPGEVLDDGLLIATGAGAIRPRRVQRAGRGPMSTDELLRGFNIPRGTVLP